MLRAFQFYSWASTRKQMSDLSKAVHETSGQQESPVLQSSGVGRAAQLVVTVIRQVFCQEEEKPKPTLWFCWYCLCMCVTLHRSNHSCFSSSAGISEKEEQSEQPSWDSLFLLKHVCSVGHGSGTTLHGWHSRSEEGEIPSCKQLSPTGLNWNLGIGCI